MNLEPFEPVGDVETSLNFSAAYAEILAQARTQGFAGFGGACFDAAIAVNKTIFGDKGEVIAALNTALWKVGYGIGHAAIRHRGAFWDADGYPKGLDEILSWGMLDPKDSDYEDLFLGLYVDFTDETCEECHVEEFSSTEAFKRSLNCDNNNIRSLTRLLDEALRRLDLRAFLRDPSSNGPLEQCHGRLNGTWWRCQNQEKWIEIIRVVPGLDAVEAFNVTDLVKTGQFSNRQPRRLFRRISRLVGPLADYQFEAKERHRRRIDHDPVSSALSL